MDAALKRDLWKAKDAVDKKVSAVQSAVQSLGRQFNESAGGHAPTNIEGIMKHIKEKVEFIKQMVGSETDAKKNHTNSIDKNWDALKNKMTGLVGNLYTKQVDRDKLNHIGKIESGVNAYAALFREGERGFAQILNGWVKEIVSTEGVSKWIEKYIEDNKRGGYFDGTLTRNGGGQLRGRIIGIITENVLEKIKEIKPKTMFDAMHSVKEKLSYIEEYMNTFNTDVMKAENAIVLAVSGYVGAQTEFVNFPNYGVQNNKHLEIAVKATLRILAVLAKHVSDQLIKLVNNHTNLSTNLQAAISAVNQIGGEFQTIGSSLGAKIQAALNSVKPSIEDLHGRLKMATEDGASESDRTSVAGRVDKAIGEMSAELTAQIGGNDPTTANHLERKRKIIFPGTEGTFDNYKRFVNQKSEILEALRGGKIPDGQDPGTLPQKIKNIQTQVQKALDHIGSTCIQAGDKLNQMTASMDIICNTGQYLNGHLNELRNNIVDGVVKSLKDNFQNLQTELAVTIKDVYSFINRDAGELRDSTISKLRNFVSQHIDFSQNSLTHRARTQYVRSIKDMLKQFAYKVTTELDGLPDAIDRDLTVGFKGFMKDFYGDENGNNINKLQKLKDEKDISVLSFAFNDFFTAINHYLHQEITRRHDEENRKKNPSLPKTSDPNASKLTTVYTALGNLLKHITEKNYYDHKLPGLLDELMNAVNGLTPRDFADPNTAILDGIRVGFVGFVNEMRKVYINKYDGADEIYNWEMEDPKKQKTTEKGSAENHMILAKDGRNCAKILMTITSMLYGDLMHLSDHCARKYLSSTIYVTSGPGALLHKMGYRVASESSKQDGELYNLGDVKGTKIGKLLSKVIRGAYNNEHLGTCLSDEGAERKKTTFNVFDILQCIFTHVEKYNDVCHYTLQPKPITPCSVYEILVWYSGLPHNRAYAELLSDGFTNVLQKPKNPLADEEDILLYDLESLYLDVHPNKITYNSLVTVISDVCSTAHDIITTIVGTGDAYTTYACDYSTNALNLYYPISGEDCLQMFLDLLRRLLPPLRFLEHQCKRGIEHSGWRDCQYGKNIAPSKWPCRDHSSDEAKCQPKGQLTCQATCQPKSPLQSYLSDCLTGYLPHDVGAVGCKSKCSMCPSTSKHGMPCLTPLGFRAFSGSSRAGIEICEVIRKLFRNVHLTSLFALSPKPPSTLPEHFGFALSLVAGLRAPKREHGGDVIALHDAFATTITTQSIDLFKNTSELTNALSSAYSSSHGSNGARHADFKNADVASLSVENPCKYAISDNLHCAPYLSNLCSDYYTFTTNKHCNLYLSWALYLPWTFHAYLKSLLDAFRNIVCQDWGCKKCMRGDKCRGGQHGVEYNCNCKNLVECQGVLATFYSFGFTYANPKILWDIETRKYCHSFYKQLTNVVSSDCFKALFEKCDDFLFKIREPFIWLNVALWSLSLLYLICVMVGRLDVLHIRSHLRIPSSHKITAQSLLAAAQVGRLAKISYLQP